MRNDFESDEGNNCKISEGDKNNAFKDNVDNDCENID